MSSFNSSLRLATNENHCKACACQSLKVNKYHILKCKLPYFCKASANKNFGYQLANVIDTKIASQ